MNKNLISFEQHVQSVFNTPSGKLMFVQLAIMTDTFTNSLVATAKLKANTGCEHPHIYYNAQRDLAEKMFNALTHSQFAELRKGVIETLCPAKQEPKKKGDQ